MKSVTRHNQNVSENVKYVPSFLDILVSILLLGNFVAIVDVWLKQYMNKDGLLNLIPMFSFQAFDPPFMVSGKPAKPIIGVHTFGDWTQVIDNATLPTPYIASSPSQTPPFGNWILKVFFGWNTSIGFALICTAALSLWVFAITSLFREKLTVQSKLVLLLCGVVGNLGFIESLDRGSLHFAVFSLLAFAFACDQNKRYSKAAFLALLIAISLKPQAAVVLIWFIYKRQYSLLIKATVSLLFVNLFMMATFAGSFTENIKNFIRAIFFFGSADSAGYIFDGISITSIAIRKYASNMGLEDAHEFLLGHSKFAMIPGLLWLLIVLAFVFTNRLAVATKAILILSLTSLVVPASATYTLTWISLGWVVWIYLNLNTLLQPFSNFIRNFHNIELREIILTASVLLISSLPLLNLYWNGWRYIPIIKDLHIVLLVTLPFALLINSFIVFKRSTN